MEPSSTAPYRSPAKGGCRADQAAGKHLPLRKYRLVNEMKQLCHRMGIDIFEVIEAAKTKPFGFQAFYPGPGLGGHCIPIDPFYLSWKAKQFDFRTKFIELAGEVNIAMPYYVMEATAAALNEQGKPLKGSKILVLGLAYKKDIDDLRESPSLTIIELLQKRGAEVFYNDPYFPKRGPRTALQPQHELHPARPP
jgi:UDP-N-acetyl-D-glucosamine dehydrogenase